MNERQRMVSAMIVDDHELVREGLRKLLELEPDIRVIAEAGDGLECLRVLDTVHPDLLFLDVRMPGVSGIETMRLIAQRHPELLVVILSNHDDEQYVSEAVRAGARAYVLKDVRRADLVRIVRDVLARKAFLDPAVAGKVFDRLRNGESGPARPDLSQRELEVMALLVAGRHDREIAAALHISEHTVQSHLKNLYRKLGVGSRVQAMARALELNLVTPPASRNGGPGGR